MASSSLLQHSNFVHGDNVLAPARGSFFQTPFQLGKACAQFRPMGHKQKLSGGSQKGFSFPDKRQWMLLLRLIPALFPFFLESRLEGWSCSSHQSL